MQPTVVDTAYPAGSLWTLRRIRQSPLTFLDELARLAGPGDVARFSLAGRPAFLLNHPDLVQDVLVTRARHFVKGDALHRARRLLGDGLLTAEGSVHASRRRAIQPAFARQRLHEYSIIMIDAATRAHHAWLDGQVRDVAVEMSGLTLTIAAKALFGAEVVSFGADVRQALADASQAIDPLVAVISSRRRVQAARRRLLAVVDALIEQGRDDPPFLALLRRADPPGDLSDQARDDALTMMLASHDTVATALTWTWIALAQHPAIAARLHAELDDALEDRSPTVEDLARLPYTHAVFAEALRLYPPAWVLARRAVGEHCIGGVLIPDGAHVLVSQYLLHRDPRFFPEPLMFDPTRWLRDAERSRPGYFPFGAGPRSCIGETFASMQGPLLLATLASRWHLAAAVPGPVRFDPRITLRPLAPVPMVFERRSARAGAHPR